MNSIGIMLFIAIDPERGYILGIADKSKYYPGSMILTVSDLSNAETIDHIIGKLLISLGINMNFSPVLDPNHKPKYPVKGIRGYSDKPEIVSKFEIEVIKSKQSEGIIATGKHFPGHRDVEKDSQRGLLVLSFDKERLYYMELKPFIAAIDNGLKNIMVVHIIFLEFDEENPTTVSKDIIKEILRDELNYTWLITSDCMEMSAISVIITSPVGVLIGIKAGVYLVLDCYTRKRQVDSINQLKFNIENNF